MERDDSPDLLSYLEGGRQVLGQAHRIYNRTLSAEEYWWLGLGLAASTLAALNDRPYSADRIEQLVERLGKEGALGDWVQLFVDELAEMDAEGLFWPRYERIAGGPMLPTGVPVQPNFNAEDAYFLALAHIAIALAVNREEQERVTALAGVVANLVESGLKPADEKIILEALQPGDSQEGE